MRRTSHLSLLSVCRIFVTELCTIISSRFFFNPSFTGQLFMQLDLQSVEKKYLSVRSHELLPPKMLEIGLPRLRMSRSFLQDLSRAVSCFSRGAVAVNHRQRFSIQLGQKRLQSCIGSKKTQEITVSTFSIQPGQIQSIPDRIEKNTGKSPSGLFRSNWVEYNQSPIGSKKTFIVSDRRLIVIVFDPVGSKTR